MNLRSWAYAAALSTALGTAATTAGATDSMEHATPPPLDLAGLSDVLAGAGTMEWGDHPASAEAALAMLSEYMANADPKMAELIAAAIKAFVTPGSEADLESMFGALAAAMTPGGEADMESMFGALVTAYGPIPTNGEFLSSDFGAAAESFGAYDFGAMKAHSTGP